MTLDQPTRSSEPPLPALPDASGTKSLDPDAVFGWAIEHKREPIPEIALRFREAARLYRRQGRFHESAESVRQEAIHWNSRLGDESRAEEALQRLNGLIPELANGSDRSFWKAQSLVMIARISARRGQPRRVLRHTKEALRLLDASQGHSDAVRAADVVECHVAILLNRGYAFYHLSKHAAARECADEAARIDRRCLFDALLLKASTLYANDPTAALEVLQECWELRAERPVYIPELLMMRSQAHLFLGRYQEAVNDGQECVRLETRPPRRIYFQVLLGRIYLYTNNRERALETLSRAYDEFTQAGVVNHHYLECGSYLVAAYGHDGQYREAIAIAQEVRERLWDEGSKATDVEYAEGWVNLELHLVEVFLVAARYEPGRRDHYLNQCSEALERAEARCGGYRVGLAIVRYFQAVVAERSGRLEEARQRLAISRRLCTHYRLFFIRWRCLEALARLTPGPKSRLELLRAAADDILQLRDNVVSPLLTLFFFNDKHRVFEQLVEDLSLLHSDRKQKGWVSEAVTYIEACKASNVVTSLAVTVPQPQAHDLTPEPQAPLPNLIPPSQSPPIQAWLRRGLPTGTISTSQVLRDGRRQRQEGRSSTLEALNGSWGVSSFNHRALWNGLDSDQLVASLLDADTLLLQYFMTENRLFCFPCTLAGGVGAPIVQEVTRHELLNLVRRCLPTASGRSALRPDTGKRLYSSLCSGLEPLFDGFKRLVVVPHGEIRHVPFGLLFDGEKYLVERFESIVHVPSLTVLWQCRQQRRPDSNTARVFCCPPSGPPWSLMEGEQTARSWESHGGPAQIWRGAQAQWSTLSSQEDSRVLHLATHGRFDAREPLASSLLFADAQGNPVWVSAALLFHLRLQTHLIVCAACESGRSNVLRSDGLTGLRYGCFVAGAPSVLDAQWAVDDLATALLVNEFYNRWLVGDDKAQALASAQRRFLRDLSGEDVASAVAGWLSQHAELSDEPWVQAARSQPWFGDRHARPFADPRYWAAFTLQGDWM